MQVQRIQASQGQKLTVLTFKIWRGVGWGGPKRWTSTPITIRLLNSWLIEDHYLDFFPQWKQLFYYWESGVIDQKDLAKHDKTIKKKGVGLQKSKSLFQNLTTCNLCNTFIHILTYTREGKLQCNCCHHHHIPPLSGGGKAPLTNGEIHNYCSIGCRKQFKENPSPAQKITLYTVVNKCKYMFEWGLKLCVCVCVHM